MPSGGGARRVFGPWGAVLGAAGAIAGALAVNLFNAGEDAEKAAKKTDKMTAAQQALEPLLTSSAGGVKELSKKYGELSEAMQTVERVSIAKALRENAAAMGELRDQAGKTIEDTRKSLEKLKNPLGEWSFGGPGGSEATKALEQALAAITKFQKEGGSPGPASPCRRQPRASCRPPHRRCSRTPVRASRRPRRRHTTEAEDEMAETKRSEPLDPGGAQGEKGKGTMMGPHGFVEEEYPGYDPAVFIPDFAGPPQQKPAIRAEP